LVCIIDEEAQFLEIGFVYRVGRESMLETAKHCGLVIGQAVMVEMKSGWRKSVEIVVGTLMMANLRIGQPWIETR
jgi:hypothetical protein